MGSRVSNQGGGDAQGEQGAGGAYAVVDGHVPPPGAQQGQQPPRLKAAPAVPDLAGRAKRAAALRALASRNAVGGYIALADAGLGVAALVTENWASLPARPLNGATSAGLLRIHFDGGRTVGLGAACTAVNAEGDAARCPAVVGQVSAATFALLLAAVATSLLAACWTLFLGPLLRRSSLAASLIEGWQNPLGDLRASGALSPADPAAGRAPGADDDDEDGPLARFHEEMAERRRRRKRAAESAAAWIRVLPAALYAAAAATYGASHGRQFTRTAFAGGSALGPSFWIAVGAAAWSAVSLFAPALAPGANRLLLPSPDEDVVQASLRVARSRAVRMALLVLAVLLVIAALAADEWWRVDPHARAGLRRVLLGPGGGAPAALLASAAPASAYVAYGGTPTGDAAYELAWQGAGDAPSACSFLAAVRFAAASLPEEGLCPPGSRCEAQYADSDYVPTAAVGRITGVTRNQIVPFLRALLYAACAPGLTPPAGIPASLAATTAGEAACPAAEALPVARAVYESFGGPQRELLRSLAATCRAVVGNFFAADTADAANALAAGEAASSPRGGCTAGLEIIGQSGTALLVCACLAAAGCLGIEGRHHILSTAILPSEVPYALMPHHKYAAFAGAFGLATLGLVVAPIAAIAASVLPLSQAILPSTSFILATLALAAAALYLLLLLLAFFTGHFFVFITYPEGWLDRDKGRPRAQFA